MKEIVFIFLISHVFSVYYMKKHGSVKVSSRDGLVYLNAYEFGKNDKIHMQFTTYRSNVDEKIYYEFSDNIPTDTFQPSKTKKPDISWLEEDDDDDGVYIGTTYKTTYDIKKNVSKKYLIIKYTGYYNNFPSGFLKIENTTINWGYVSGGIITFIFILAFLVFSIVSCYFKYIKKKSKKKKHDIKSITVNKIPKTNDNIETSPQEEDIFYEPSNREDVDKNYDLNNNLQQENIYYEPPKIENTNTINDSNCSNDNEACLSPTLINREINQ